MTDAAPQFTSLSYSAPEGKHCAYASLSADCPCHGEVARWPGWDVYFCEGHRPDGGYTPESAQEGGDLIDTAAESAAGEAATLVEPGQQTFLSPEEAAAVRQTSR